jgi:hypothetical protein
VVDVVLMALLAVIVHKTMVDRTTRREDTEPEPVLSRD